MGAKWSAHELEVLSRNYPLHGSHVNEWDETLNRPIRALQQKAFTLGIRKVFADQCPIDAEITERVVGAWENMCKSIGVDEEEAYAAITFVRSKGRQKAQ